MITTVGDADAYFATRAHAGDTWASGADKDGALSLAETMLDADYELDGENSRHLVAIYEQALFILQQGAALDSRAGLQAQAVTQAGLMQETYGAAGIPVCALAKAYLKGAERSHHRAAYLGTVPLYRDTTKEF